VTRRRCGECSAASSALDVTTQAQILAEIGTLRNELGVGVLLITHDLGVIADVADRVVVMYAGQVVEQGSLSDIFYDPGTRTPGGCWGRSRAWTRTARSACRPSPAPRPRCSTHPPGAALRRSAPGGWRRAVASQSSRATTPKAMSTWGAAGWSWTWRASGGWSGGRWGCPLRGRLGLVEGPRVSDIVRPGQAVRVRQLTSY
jgi:ABC-type glutathione transport system ATPase component